MTEKNVYGHFQQTKGVNTYFDFDTAGHFTFTQRNPLKPLFNKSDYITSKGVWTFQNGRYITLNSLTADTDYKTIIIEKKAEAKSSSFIFFDITGDTLPIVGATKNEQWFGRVHNLMKSFELMLSQGDTVTADLIGYEKFRFIHSDNSQFVYHVFLYPSYVDDYFRNKKLLLRRNKIIDLELHEIYKKKSGM